MSTHADLQRQNARLELLLNLANTITSNLDLRDVICAISGNIRTVMRGDMASVALREEASGQARIYALDFPEGKGVLREGLLVTPTSTIRQAMDNRRPVILNTNAPEQFAPEVQAELALAEGTKSVCIAPLVSRARSLGVLSVARSTDNPFSDDEVDFLCKVAAPIAIAVDNALAYKEISELRDKLAQEKLYLEDEIRSEMGFEQIVGNGAALKHVLQMVETVAPSDSTVLLLGETGTGKELIARAIHDHSRRNQRIFVKLNCAAIPTGLLESELFGHEKGAFTGAISQKAGRMELADQGTLFLDEVGDIPIEIQPKLLRVLQEREFERLGSTHTRRVNVRLVAATNRDLEKMVADREFRSDLFYRLNVFPIRIPPLRERKEDIPLLVRYFTQKFSKQMQKHIESVPTAVMKGLTAWDWPGNIRELENFIERAVILSRGRSLEAPLSELRIARSAEPVKSAPDDKPVVESGTRSSNQRDVLLEEHARRKRDEIVRALTECNGRVGGADGAAARLGINRTTLLSRMKKFGIYAKQFA